MPQLLPIIVGTSAGAADGIVVAADQKAGRYACATGERKTLYRAAVLGVGLALDTAGVNPEVSQGLAVAGAAMLASRISLGLARGGQVPRGPGCPAPPSG